MSQVRQFGESRPIEDMHDDAMECRICRAGTESGRLVRACRCHAWVHAGCLQQWLDTRPAGLPRTRDGEVLTSSLCCEVCKSQYLVRIESRMDGSRLFSPRSCEAYFECGSLLVTLGMLCTTPWLLWSAASPKERQILADRVGLVGLVSVCMMILALAALRRIFVRWRRAQAYPAVVSAA
uniref:RING-CH-type domain-containing protein n=1 Tax=Cryptomonas curvata TaxID=233186 RepID=A0A7S0M919_9CRYP